MQRSLIRWPILPLPEVPDKAHPTNISSPGCLRVHHCIIQPNRKKDERFGWLLFSLKGQLDFPLDPIAFDGIFGEDEEQLVLPLDSVVDLGAQLVASF